MFYRHFSINVIIYYYNIIIYFNCYINLLLFCTIDKISFAYKFKFTIHMCCWFAVCPVPKTKEEEEFIKERERNRELMEEIAREIEMTCLGKLKNEKKKQ